MLKFFRILRIILKAKFVFYVPSHKEILIFDKESQNALAEFFTNKKGNIEYDFKGKLSFSWPKYASHFVLNRFDKPYDPLFAYGFGLTYKDNVNLGKLNTHNDFVFEVPTNTPYVIMQGRAKGDWNYQLQTEQETKDIQTPVGKIQGLSMIEADKEIQGDAKEFTWTGSNHASALISSTW